MNKLHIACIGAGYIAGKHLANLSAMGDVEIAGVADVDSQRAAEQAQRFGGRAYRDWRRLLDEEKPDAVYLCVPPFVHGEPEEALLAARLPFFVEKPLGLDAELPERVAQTVEAQGLITSVGYHWRYLDTMDRARTLAVAHRPRLALGYWFDFVPPPSWWIRREASGGQTVEQTTHIFDLARYLLGDVKRVFSAACPDGLANLPEADIDAVSAATLQFHNGAIAVITSTCLVHYPHRIGLWLYAQDLILECREFSLRIETAEGRQFFEPKVDPYRAEDEAFVRAVRTGDTTGIRVPYSEALQTHRLILRVLESAREAQPLELGPEVSVHS